MSTNDTASSPVFLTPDQQSFILLGPSGQDNITVPMAAANELWSTSAAQAINYGSQIGACLIMLVVLLAMTPKARFKRPPTIISVAALTLNLIRLVLLSLFYTSSWLKLYTVMSGDVQFVAQKDYNISVVATALSIPVTILVELLLFLQAWSMVQLWPRVYRIIAILISAALIIATLGFNFAATILQCLYIVYGNKTVFEIWIRRSYLALVTTTVTWFCLLFISRLVLHLWKTHSILPSLKGLTAMDVLVMTNGILMIIPVIFASFQYGHFDIQSGSLVLTSVIVLLPLGTLVAQRLANPAWFTAPDSASVGGASNRPLLGSKTVSHSAAHNNSFQGKSHGVTTSQISSGGRSPGFNEKGRVYHADQLDAELARIDNEDLERGGGVRVARSIEHTVQAAPGQTSPKSS